jgi:hypothetical protein
MVLTVANQMAPNRRRGATYLIVLGTALAITVIGLSAITATRIERRWADASVNFTQARLHAESAINVGLLRIEQDANWRTTYSSGLWESSKNIGTGTYTLQGIDPDDGDLANDATDPLLLRGEGMAGFDPSATSYTLEVKLNAHVPPLTCLERPVHTGSNVDFTSAQASSNPMSDAISANGNISALSSTINADVEAAGTISGLGYNGQQTSGIKPRTMPNSSAFDDYIANGTEISLGSIPSGTIEKVVLSPGNNPYGATNPQGIYVVRCETQDITIRNCRIAGTLVLLDAGSGSRIRDSVIMTSAVGNYPTLLVRGSISLELSSASLSEASLDVNFNPSHSPYQGIHDEDKVDSYPSRLNGLVYVSGDVATSNVVNIDGVLVVGGKLSISSTLSLSYRDRFLNDPPPGFTAPPRMVIAPGTWRQIVTDP